MNDKATELQCERISLRRWRLTDADTLYELASDPAVAECTGFPAHKSVEDSRRVIQEILSAPECYAIILHDSGNVIGCIQTFANDGQSVYAADTVEIGFWLGRKYWSRGFMTEGVSVLFDAQCHKPHEFKYNRMIGRTKIGNGAAQRVFEKCQFVQSGEENGYRVYERFIARNS